MYIGVDFGGTKIAACLADKNGVILKKITAKTLKSPDGKAIVAQLVEIIKSLQPKNKKIKAVGIGIPGQIDKAGTVFNMPNVPALLGVNIQKALKAKLKLPIIIENDANAAALAELKYGAGKKLNNFVFITISTGIGGGIIINRELYRGANNTAGEVGHMVIVPDGPRCGCGNRGCWEVLGSGTALANMAKARIQSGVVSLIMEKAANDLNQVNGEAIAEAARKQDPLALELLDVNGFYNAVGITNLVNCFDPEAIIIGGGLSFNGETFFKPLEKCLKMFKLLNGKNKIKILRAGCKKDTGLLGALSLVVPK